MVGCVRPIALGLSVLLIACGAPRNVLTARTLIEDPARYDGEAILLVGTVENPRMHVPSQGPGYTTFTLSDGTARVPVMSGGRSRSASVTWSRCAARFTTSSAWGARWCPTPSRRSSCASSAPLHNRPERRSARHRGASGRRGRADTAEVALDRIPELLGRDRATLWARLHRRRSHREAG